MLKPSLTEGELYGYLSDRGSPSSEGLLARLRETNVSTRATNVWQLRAMAGITLASVVGLLLLSRPSYSWADVIKTASEQRQYTISNTRLMNGSTERVAGYVVYRDGDLWRSGTKYGLKDRTVTVRHFPGFMNYVLVDARQDPPAVSFRIQDILRDGAPATVQRNVSRHGKLVDVFHLTDTYRNAGKAETLDEEVVVDPKTHLPAEVTVMRDSGHWGDIWDYDYSKPDPSVFVPAIDKDAHVFNLIEQRKELEAALGKNPDALFIDDEEHMPLMLVHGKLSKYFRMNKMYLTLKGYKGTYRGTQRPMLLAGRKGVCNTLRLAGRDWEIITLAATFRGYPNLQINPGDDELTGELRRNGQTLSFVGARVLRTGSSEAFLNSFGEALVAVPGS